MYQKMKKTLILFLTVFCIFAAVFSVKTDEAFIPGMFDAMLWEDQQAPNCKFYATIDGVTRECTREEYERYNVHCQFKLNGKTVRFNRAEYEKYSETGVLLPQNTVEKN